MLLINFIDLRSRFLIYDFSDVLLIKNILNKSTQSRNGPLYSNPKNKFFLQTLLGFEHATSKSSVFCFANSATATIRQGCRSATRFRDCRTKKKIKKTRSHEAAEAPDIIEA